MTGWGEADTLVRVGLHMAVFIVFWVGHAATRSLRVTVGGEDARVLLSAQLRAWLAWVGVHVGLVVVAGPMHLLGTGLSVVLLLICVSDLRRLPTTEGASHGSAW